MSALVAPHRLAQSARCSTRSRPSRMVGVDAARGAAILGMLHVHLTYAPDGSSIAAGRSSALFAVLAGVSLALLTGGSRPDAGRLRRRARLTILLRGLLLIAIGLALWAIPGLPFAVILDTYGVLFVALLPVLFARRRMLLALAVLAATAGAELVWLSAGASPEDRFSDLPSVWFLTGEYPGLVFVAYLLIGMIAARSDLRRHRTLRNLLVCGVLIAVVGYGVGGLVPGQTAAPHSDTTWEVLGDGGTALAVIGLLQIASRLRPLEVVLMPVAALGSMPLTIYVLQVLAVLFLPFSYAATQTFALVAVGSIVFALVWRSLIGQGPLEAFVSICTRTRVLQRERAAGGSTREVTTTVGEGP